MLASCFSKLLMSEEQGCRIGCVGIRFISSSFRQICYFLPYQKGWDWRKDWTELTQVVSLYSWFHAILNLFLSLSHHWKAVNVRIHNLTSDMSYLVSDNVFTVSYFVGNPVFYLTKISFSPLPGNFLLYDFWK